MPIHTSLLAWKGGKVAQLAASAYQQRILPSFTLDSARLTVLANTLEEAGLDNHDMLHHLRNQVVHVRGCWVLDLLLNNN
jgi:hypothetical protein